MSLHDARMPSLRDKLRLEEEARLEGIRLEELEEKSKKKETVEKKKKSKTL